MMMGVWVVMALTARVARAGWIDPDTKKEHMTLVSLEDGREFELVGTSRRC